MANNREQRGAIEAPAFPMMGTATVSQEQPMAVNMNHSENRNSHRRRPKRRSSSFDDRMPIPKISLKPRYRRDMQELQHPRQLPLSLDALIHQENSSACSQKKSPTSRKRSHHFRSYTFDGNDMYHALTNSTDSPHASVTRRPIARHLYPRVPTPASSSTTTNGVGTICSSSTSAFESTSSTFAQSRQGDSATAGSFESLRDPSLVNDQWPNNTHVTLTSPRKKYPSEVRVMGDSKIKPHKYRESFAYDSLDSPNSSGSDVEEMLRP